MATPNNLLKYSVSQTSINNFESKIVSQNVLEQKSLILKRIKQFFSLRKIFEIYRTFLNFYYISRCIRLVVNYLDKRGGGPRNRPRRTHRVSGSIAQLFLNVGTGSGVWSSSRPGRLYPRERPGTHCTGGWVGPGAGVDSCEKSRLTGIRSPDLPARSESLYWLRCPGSSSWM